MGLAADFSIQSFQHLERESSWPLPQVASPSPIPYGAAARPLSCLGCAAPSWSRHVCCAGMAAVGCPGCSSPTTTCLRAT